MNEKTCGCGKDAVQVNTGPRDKAVVIKIKTCYRKHLDNKDDLVKVSIRNLGTKREIELRTVSSKVNVNELESEREIKTIDLETKPSETPSRQVAAGSKDNLENPPYEKKDIEKPKRTSKKKGGKCRCKKNERNGSSTYRQPIEKQPSLIVTEEEKPTEVEPKQPEEIQKVQDVPQDEIKLEEHKEHPKYQVQFVETEKKNDTNIYKPPPAEKPMNNADKSPRKREVEKPPIKDVVEKPPRKDEVEYKAIKKPEMKDRSQNFEKPQMKDESQNKVIEKPPMKDEGVLVTQQYVERPPATKQVQSFSQSTKLPLLPLRYHGRGCALEVSVWEKHEPNCPYKKEKNPDRNPIDDRSASYEAIGRVVFKTCKAQNPLTKDAALHQSTMVTFYTLVDKLQRENAETASLMSSSRSEMNFSGLEAYLRRQEFFDAVVKSSKSFAVKRENYNTKCESCQDECNCKETCSCDGIDELFVLKTRESKEVQAFIVKKKKNKKWLKIFLPCIFR